MNAVERLLAHGERALQFFTGAYREQDFSPLRDKAEPVARRTVELLDRDAGWRGWQSRIFLCLAAIQSLGHKPASARPAEALRLYREMLDERRRLLSSKQLTALVKSVVRESPSWGDLARDVVRRAEAVAAAVERLRSLPGDPSPWGYSEDSIDARLGRRLGRRLKQALDRLHAFEHPPKAGKQAGQEKPGRPREVDEETQRELAEAWLEYSRRYDGDGRATKNQFVAERCKGQRKGQAELVALQARTLRDLETALKNRRRKQSELKRARTK